MADFLLGVLVGKGGTSAKAAGLRCPSFDLSIGLLKMPLLAFGPNGPVRLMTNSVLTFTLRRLDDVFNPHRLTTNRCSSLAHQQ